MNEPDDIPNDIPEIDTPACYCLFCNWSGHDDDLFEDIVRGFSVCPQCLGEEIVYTE